MSFYFLGFSVTDALKLATTFELVCVPANYNNVGFFASIDVCKVDSFPPQHTTGFSNQYFLSSLEFHVRYLWFGG